jgi:hypothetical protein
MYVFNLEHPRQWNMCKEYCFAVHRFVGLLKCAFQAQTERLNYCLRLPLLNNTYLS